MSIKTGKRLLIAFWIEAFLVFVTIIKQATASKYNKDLNVIERAPAWDWNTYLVVHLIALGVLGLLTAAYLTIKYVHEAEQRELNEYRNKSLKKSK